MLLCLPFLFFKLKKVHTYKKVEKLYTSDTYDQLPCGTKYPTTQIDLKERMLPDKESFMSGM